MDHGARIPHDRAARILPRHLSMPRTQRERSLATRAHELGGTRLLRCAPQTTAPGANCGARSSTFASPEAGGMTEKEYLGASPSRTNRSAKTPSPDASAREIASPAGRAKPCLRAFCGGSAQKKRQIWRGGPDLPSVRHPEGRRHRPTAGGNRRHFTGGRGRPPA